MFAHRDVKTRWAGIWIRNAKHGQAMNIDFSFFLKLFWRRLPVMVFFLIACSVVGILTAMRLPDTFSTSARLLVEAPQIQIDSTTVQTEATEQLEIIEQKLLTRANLLDIARDYDVFENMEEMEPDTIVRQMQSATRIQRRAGRNRATLMTISFEGRSSKIVFDVVNAMETLVLAENVNLRKSRATNTLAFFEEEVERLSVDLDRKSEAIAVFKTENADALPEDQSYRLQRQTQLLEREGLRERELAAISAQREEVIRIFQSSGVAGFAGETERRRTQEEQRLINARAELELLRATYSDENPRVQRKVNEVERLEAIVVAQVASNQLDPEASNSAEARDQAILEARLAQVDSTIAFQNDELERTREELFELEKSIAQSSANGIELATLERDYAIILSRYNAAVVNLNGAQMDNRIESQAQGQRISTIESANRPSVPSGPDRTRIAVISAGFGMMLAGAYYALLEILNRNVRRPAELINRFNVTPITTIPYMESRGRRFLRRSGLAFATLAVLIGVPGLLFYIDTNYLPLEVVVERGLKRLGLG